MIQPGKYLATCTGSALGRAGNGTEQIAVGFDVHLGADQQSVAMTWYGFFTDNALQTTEKAIAALGFDMAARDMSEIAPDDPSASVLVGAEAEVVVENETDDQGNVRPRIRWVNRPGGNGVVLKERMAPQEVKSFGSQIRARLLAKRGGQGASPRPQPQRPAGGAPPARPGVPPARPAAARPAAPAPQGQDNFDDIPFLWFVVLAISLATAATTALPTI